VPIVALARHAARRQTVRSETVNVLAGLLTGGSRSAILVPRYAGFAKRDRRSRSLGEATAAVPRRTAKGLDGQGHRSPMRRLRRADQTRRYRNGDRPRSDVQVPRGLPESLATVSGVAGSRRPPVDGAQWHRQPKAVGSRPGSEPANLGWSPPTAPPTGCLQRPGTASTSNGRAPTVPSSSLWRHGRIAEPETETPRCPTSARIPLGPPHLLGYRLSGPGEGAHVQRRG
jgi:hypothetical protein